jgi:hypothetical protein
MGQERQGAALGHVRLLVLGALGRPPLQIDDTAGEIVRSDCFLVTRDLGNRFTK